MKKSGDGGQILVDRGTSGSELLQKELLRLSYRAAFNPAVYEHHTLAVKFIGTVVFVVRDGEPHLRIYLHQQEEDFKSNADFVAPQLALATIHQLYNRPRWPKGMPTAITGAVALLNVEVDLKGKVTGVSVAFEHPEGMGLGEEGMRFIRTCDFIPGYRNGRPVTSKFSFPLFWGNGHNGKIQ